MARLYRFNTKELLKVLFDYISFSNEGTISLDYIKLKTDLGETAKKSKSLKEF